MTSSSRRHLPRRDIIGQAKGIIMATRHISSDAAYTALVAASQDLNLKLRDVARRVTDAGELRPNRTRNTATTAATTGTVAASSRIRCKTVIVSSRDSRVFAR